MAVMLADAWVTSALVVSCARMINEPGLVRLPFARLSTTPVNRVTTSLVRAGTPEDSASQLFRVISGPLAEPPHRCKLRGFIVLMTNVTSVTTGAGVPAGGVLPVINA